ncbi:MAG: hypothetical protein IKP28_06055 [Clostridia bacterium]|nr:hypothetical protein [Clostridia bacterium]
MARDDYRSSPGEMENNHRKNQMISAAAREVGISASDLSDEVHARKSNWDEGDFSYSDLLRIAREIKAEQDKKKRDRW